MIPALLNENPRDIISNFEEKPFPQIECASEDFGLVDAITCKEFVVSVEGNTIAKTQCFLKAFEIFFSAFYIFNLEYPKALKATLTFIQKEIIQLNDGAPEIGRVINLITKLKRTFLEKGGSIEN